MTHQRLLELCDQVDVPIEALTQPIALLANREGGKTYGGMKILELAYDAGVQCGVLDPIGKWWGLRLGKDGKSPGLKDVYIFGGKHADFPLQPDKGAFIAKLVVEKRIHFILDVSLMRKGERRRFMAAFLEELYLLKKQQDNPTAMVLFLEEAHFVAPQKPQNDEAQMLGAIQDIVAEGRNAGIGIVLMDQRPARVNKDVLALIEVVIALRIIHNLDRRAIEDWIVQKVTAEKKVKLSDELPFFKKGAGYLYAPVYDLFGKIQILPKRTYDSTASVKIGQLRAEIGQLTPVDAEAVKSAMAEVLQEAEANDPKFLRRRVAELERALAQKIPAVTKTVVTQAKPIKVEVPALKESEVARLGRDVSKLREASVSVAATARMIEVSIEAAKVAAAKTEAALRSAATTQAKPLVMKAPPARDFFRHEIARADAERRDRATVHNGDTALKEGQRKVLIAVAQRENDGLKRSEINVLAGYRKSTRNRLLQELHAIGCVTFDGQLVRVTEAGVAALGNDYEPLPLGSALRDHWLRKLPAGNKAVLEVLLRHFPDAIEREQIDQETEYKKSTRNRLLQELQAMTLVEKSGTTVRASPKLFDSAAA